MKNDVPALLGVVDQKVDEVDHMVSVITPVLNGVKYVERCIQSVLRQGYPRIEHVFADGGSIDGTLEMLSHYTSLYPDRIRYVSGPDKNAADGWNKGLEMARGEIFGWLGADDTYEPDAVQTVVKFFKSNPRAVFAFGDCNIIDDKNGKTVRFEAMGGNASEQLQKLLTGPNYIATTSAFYKREVVERVGIMDTRLNGNGCDLDYWIRVAKVYDLHRIGEVLSNFRLREDSTSGSKDALRRNSRDLYLISRRHGGSIFSNYGVVHFGSPLLRLCRPILGPLYPFVSDKIVYPLVRKARKLGGA